MAIALLTPYVTPYRVPLFERLADRYGVEVLCFGGGERYVPSWFADLDAQLATAPFPARRLDGPREALTLRGRYEAVIAPLGGAVLPAAYLGARARRRRFLLWASVWSQPRSAVHLLARPLTRHIYRRADAILTYGPHVSRFVAGVRGSEQGVFVATQAVEAELFARPVRDEEIVAFREAHSLGDGPIVAYVGRLIAAKGIEVLLEAWASLARSDATLVLVGDGPFAVAARGAAGVRLLEPLAREQLPVVYAASAFTVLPSIPTPRFTEPWGLVCNEAMHQGRPVIASDAVGAVAGGLVVDEQTGLVVPAGDVDRLSAAIARLLDDPALRSALGAAARDAVGAYNYDAAASAFGAALSAAGIGARPARRS